MAECIPATAFLLGGTLLDSAASRLYRQFSIASAQSNPINEHPNIRSNNGRIPRKARYRPQEIAKEHHDAVQLDEEADKGPSQEDQRQPAEECSRACRLLFPREEEQCLLRSDALFCKIINSLALSCSIPFAKVAQI